MTASSPVEAEKGWSLTAAALSRQDAQAPALALSLPAAYGSGVPLAAQGYSPHARG